MKQNHRKLLQTLCLWAGALLIAGAAAMLILWQRNISVSARQAAAHVHTLRSLIPQPRGAAAETRRDNTMAVLSLDGTDFVGILELPGHGSALPVCADWGKTTQYPCRLRGSIYDGSLQIGGTSQRGQYDFFRDISVGDSVFFTDMEGNRYAYTVTDLRYEKHADETALQQQDAGLTLFIKNIYAFEYLIVFCDVPQ